MHFAFTLFKYFPYGGLQRDFHRLALEAVRRGHRVTALAVSWQGPKPDGIELLEANTRSWSRFRRYRRFADWVAEQVRLLAPDCLVGFNKLPGLDVYYAADPCFRELAAARSGFYRLLPASRHYTRFEAAVLEENKTHLLLLSRQQLSAFRRHYRLPDERVTLLPPGIRPELRAPANYEARREAMRRQFGIDDQVVLLLAIGSGFTTKGVDLTLSALSGLPPAIRQQCLLKVIGQGRVAAFRRLAGSLGVADQVEFLGGRDDVPDWLLAGDLLVHPARREVTGMVLLEAVAAGCPVLVSDVCGYAPLVIRAGAGLLLPSPVSGDYLRAQLARLITAPAVRRELGARGRAAGAEADWFSLPEVAIDAIERCALAARTHA